MAQYLDDLRQTNTALAEFIDKKRETETQNANGEEVAHEEIELEDFVKERNQNLIEQFSSKEVREKIDDFRRLGDGTDTLTDAQNDLIEALSDSNEEFANFLRANPGATMGAYARSQVVATIKTYALSAATTLLNSALTFGLSAAIQLIISGITSWIHKYDDLCQKNAELFEQFQELTMK